MRRCLRQKLMLTWFAPTSVCVDTTLRHTSVMITNASNLLILSMSKEFLPTKHMYTYFKICLETFSNNYSTFVYLDQIFFQKLYTIQCLKILKTTYMYMKKQHSALETKLLNAILLSTAISNWNWIFKSTTQTLQLLAMSRVSCSVHCLYDSVTF